MKEVIRTTCTRDCWDSCGLLAHVQDGKVTSLMGDPDHPITQGLICGKTRRFPERLYSKDRILHPLQKVDSEWRPISWDEALDLAAAKLLEYRAKLGGLSVFHLQSAGSMGALKMLNTRFFNLFGGVTTMAGSLCASAGSEAQMRTYGCKAGHDPLDLLNSRTIIVWGRNPAVTNIHLIPILKEARVRGAEVVVIDPVHTQTAQLANVFLQPRPGGDLHLALGAAKACLEGKQVNSSIVERVANGFTAYRELVRSTSWSEIVEKSGLSREQIQRLADCCFDTRPTSFVLGVGLQHWAHGAEVLRLIDGLAMLTGNIGIPGGGVNFTLDEWRFFDKAAMAEGRAAAERKLSAPLIAQGLLEATQPPIAMAWIDNVNPVSQGPNSNKSRQAIAKLDFCVVVDQFMTATAELADLFLPSTTFLEEEDLEGSYWHNFVGPVNRVVEPLEEAKPDLEIFQALADRLGFGGEMAGSARDWLESVASPLLEKGTNLEELRTGPFRATKVDDLPFADGRFDTASGKFEFITKIEERIAEKDDDYPLHLLSIKAPNWHNSQAFEEQLMKVPQVVVNPAALKSTTLRDGGEVFLESPVGALRARLALDIKQRIDVAVINHRPQGEGGGGVNVLTLDLASREGDGVAYYDTKVRIREIKN